MKFTKKELYKLVEDLIPEPTFNAEIKSRYEAYGKLVSEDAIAYIIVDELGRNIQAATTITELRDGSEATLYVTVTGIHDVREFTRKTGSKGEVIDLEIADTTGKCQLVLWDLKLIDLVKRGEITVGTKLKLINTRAKVTPFGLRISLGRWGALIINPPELLGDTLAVSLPPAPPEAEEQTTHEELQEPVGTYTDISALQISISVNVKGTVLSAPVVRTFKRKDDTTGFVANMELYDGTGQCRVVCWDDNAKATEGYNIGDEIEIYNGYTKLNKAGQLEIHVSNRGKIRKL
jgi:ssDNA-binding replication factor A large subunit